MIKNFPEAQPLLSQARRLSEALAYIGEPLPKQSKALLKAAESEPDDVKAVALVQQALDPLCLATINLVEGKPLEARAMANRLELCEQGWRAVLVKVVNGPGLTTPLRIKSASARPLPESPPNEVAQRWLELEPFTQRPLAPTLSGLGLEYIVLQIYSHTAGKREAIFEFNALQPAPGARLPVRSWDFTKNTDGWKAESDCTLSVMDGKLRVQTLDRDPYMVAPVRLPGGSLRLRFRALTNQADFGQVFWSTEERPQFDGGRQVAFAFQPGSWSEYNIPFVAEGNITQIRLDFGQKAGLIEIESLELATTDSRDALWVPLSLTLETLPSRAVKLSVRDERGKPCVARFTIRDTRGRIYPLPSKRLAPDFAFQSQIYRKHGEVLRLPKGAYTITCQRGPESVPETKKLVVGSGPATLAYKVRRWIDPSHHGWWSGDHHIHAAGCAHYSHPTEGVLPEDMARHIQGEDLKVGCNLTWGPCFDYQKQFFTGKDSKTSTYPYLLRYDIEVSGFGSHASGHLCLLRLKDQLYPGGTSKDHWPTLCLNTLRWAKKQGAITGFAHSGIGLEVEKKELPSFVVPRFDGIGAVEYIVDVTHTVPGPTGKLVAAVDFISAMDTDLYAELNIWYHTLNCGFRTRISGETDFPCLSGERVGKGRSYVKLLSTLTFDAWVAGIQSGRCYVSDGSVHLLDFSLENQPLGGRDVRLERPATLTATLKAAAQDAITVEAIVNGSPVASVSLPGDGQIHSLKLPVPITQSSWVALRVLGQAHTNPIWVIVAGKPVRASQASAHWCRAGVDACWSQKERLIVPKELADARAAYDYARRTYERILKECVA